MNTTTVPTGLTQAEANREIDSGTTAALMTADGKATDRLENLSHAAQKSTLLIRKHSALHHFMQ